ncbi:Hypothetical predicted protein [Paramuricea clavata]|uniref:Uncharacterized protein n=1 Tax=Paramuricea clavata TaxID=317549 RepID=A0A6S7ITD3_PARCT|nr:Hypothetical predicted protein [Paramuricea clavata]
MGIEDQQFYMQPVKEKATCETNMCDDEVDEDVHESGYNELLLFDFECIQENGTHEGYDGYFIQQYLHENGVIPEVIMCGAKILTMYVAIPKTFGLNESAKGYFPHLMLDPYHQVLITIPVE